MRLLAILRALTRLEGPWPWLAPATVRGRPLPPIVRLLAPFFHGQALALGSARGNEQSDVAGEEQRTSLVDRRRWNDRLWLRAEPSWAHRIATGRVSDVAEEALRRLRQVRLEPSPASSTALAATVRPLHLCATLLFPQSPGSLISALRTVVHQPDEAVHHHAEV